MELIKTHGGGLQAGWWTQRKLAWCRFTDDNVRANAKKVKRWWSPCWFSH